MPQADSKIPVYLIMCESGQRPRAGQPMTTNEHCLESSLKTNKGKGFINVQKGHISQAEKHLKCLFSMEL